jgi:hypothetical protein
MNKLTKVAAICVAVSAISACQSTSQPSTVTVSDTQKLSLEQDLANAKDSQQLVQYFSSLYMKPVQQTDSFSFVEVKRLNKPEAISVSQKFCTQNLKGRFKSNRGTYDAATFKFDYSKSDIKLAQKFGVNSAEDYINFVEGIDDNYQFKVSAFKSELSKQYKSQFPESKSSIYEFDWSTQVMISGRCNVNDETNFVVSTIGRWDQASNYEATYIGISKKAAIANYNNRIFPKALENGKEANSVLAQYLFESNDENSLIQQITITPESNGYRSRAYRRRGMAGPTIRFELKNSSNVAKHVAIKSLLGDIETPQGSYAGVLTYNNNNPPVQVYGLGCALLDGSDEILINPDGECNVRYTDIKYPGFELNTKTPQDLKIYALGEPKVLIILSKFDTLYKRYSKKINEVYTL